MLDSIPYDVAEMIQNIAIDMGVSPQGVLCSALDLRPSIAAEKEEYHLYEKEYWAFMLLCAVVI